MSDFNSYSRQDQFVPTLQSDIDSLTTSLILSTAPSFTLAGGQSCYAEIDYDVSSKYERVQVTAVSGTTLTVTRGLSKYDGGPSTATTHSSGAKVLFGPTFGVEKDIATAVNSKMDKSGGTWTGPTTGPVYANAAARNAAIPSPTDGQWVYLTAEGRFEDRVGGSWVSRASGAVSNAADHTAGKVDLASPSELTAGTANDATSGAPNVVPVSSTVVSSSGAGDAGKVPVLGATGKLADGFVNAISNTTFDAKGDLITATANDTPVRLAVGSNDQVLIADSAQSAGIKWGTIPLVAANFKSGITSRAGNTASGSQTIAHGLGKTPAYVRITIWYVGLNSFPAFSLGTFDGTTSSCMFGTSNTGIDGGVTSAYMVTIKDQVGGTQEATIGIDSTNITLNWVKTGTVVNEDMNILWEVFG